MKPTSLFLASLLAVCDSSLSAHLSPEPPGQFVTLAGHRTWYRVAGHGHPLVLVPGGPGGSHTYFYPHLERLADSFAVIYYDPYGRGLSDRARDSRDYTFQRDVDEIELLRQALHLGRITVYGHSYGGMVAQAYALKYPSSLSHLILADTFHGAEMWQRGLIDNVDREVQNQFPEVWEQLERLRSEGVLSCDSTYRAVSAGIPDALLYYYDPGSGDREDWHSNPQVGCRIAGPNRGVVLGGDLASLEFRADLKAITIPTLIIAGRFDRVSMPRYAVQYRALMPQATFVMFEHSGHEPFLEIPQQHDSIVRGFLGRE